MTVDRWCNRIENLLRNSGLLSKLSNFMFVFICEFDDCLVTKSLNVIDFNKSLEYWEAMLCICNLVVAVHVDSCDFNFITRTCRVD